jgi:serine/threonine-protein kinase SBK
MKAGRGQGRLMRNVRSDTLLNPNCSPRTSITECLPQRVITDHYNVIRELGSGTYGTVLLTRCRLTRSEVALKVLPKKTTKLKDFLREFNISYYLSPHRAIINTYDVAFESPDAFVFVQEYAPVGDLFEAITPQVGLPEHQAKAVARSVASALEFMHSKNLVHRDIKPENVALFDEHFRRLKLMDFGLTKKAGTLVRKVSAGIPYTAPEICDMAKGERYAVDSAVDVWAFAILLYCTLTGNFPWELAHTTNDNYYGEFVNWHRRRTTSLPSQWTRFWPRALQAFRKLLDPKPERRSPVTEINKYLEDDWLLMTDNTSSHVTSTHVLPDEVDTFLEMHGIETTLDKQLQDRRIRDWILST